ncbi:hypothetical protein UMM65_07710 [Aureibaculum sp. 2210JD6-5]|uniref:hypothetical protein n=1 Tax=Aureibaculum sp. 2210JD6-5 TaxID=3103957 RepID=UPI002AAEEF0C|nr:hypothetical protein [Aureibaculum sp. 2210JD6-5]MDY7395124.1 hypothetical protein [Aureibaculum sp. 2210JD6-5]
MKKIISLLILLIVVFTSNAQEDDDAVQTSNIQEYTPSKLLRKGQWDIKFFNSIYTQTKSTDEGSKSVKIDRQTFFTNTTEIYTGVSENSRINVGVILQVRSNTFGGAGALEVFKFKNNTTNARSGLTTIAPSIRVQPFANVGNFSFTSSLYIPVFKDEGLPGQFNDPPYLDKKSFNWETKFFYDNTFGAGKWQIFTEADFGFNFGKKGEDLDFNSSNVGEHFANNSLFVPLSAYLSYFPNYKTTVFANAQQSFLVDLGNNFSQNSTALGFGGKYQLTNALNVEVSFSKIVRGYSFQGLGQTYSLGLRWLL